MTVHASGTESVTSRFFLFVPRHDYVSSSLLPQMRTRIPIQCLPFEDVAALLNRTVEGIAAHLVEIISHAQPEGPYYIAGYSFGGILAYEICNQLIGQDREIAFLGLIDTTYDERLRNNIFCPTELWKNELRAERLQYVAYPIPARVHLFSTSDTAGSQYQGWDRIVPQNQIRLIKVPAQDNSWTRVPNSVFLADQLSGIIERVSTEEPVRMKHPATSLVPLQVGTRAVSPLICVPGAGASVTSFAAVVSSLDRSLPVYGLEPRGLDGLSVPHSTVQAAAATYFSSMSHVYHNRDVHLFAHSFGGWIAFEMAQQLEHTNISVKSIIILDSEAPSDDVHRANWDYGRVLMTYVDSVELLLNRSIGVRRADFDVLDADGSRALLHHLLVKERLLPSSTKPSVLTGSIRALGTALRARYRPEKPCPLPIHLILLDNPKLDEVANKEAKDLTIAEWRTWAPNLVCSQILGNHMTVLRPPYAQQLASVIGKLVKQYD